MVMIISTLRIHNNNANNNIILLIIVVCALFSLVHGQCTEEFSCHNAVINVPNYTDILCANFSCWNSQFNCPNGCSIKCVGMISCISIRVTNCGTGNCPLYCNTTNTSCWGYNAVSNTTTDFSGFTACYPYYCIRDLSNFDQCTSIYAVLNKFDIPVSYPTFCNYSYIYNVGPKLADLQYILPAEYIPAIRAKSDNISQLFNFFWSNITNESLNYALSIYDEGFLYFTESYSYKCRLFSESLNASWTGDNGGLPINFYKMVFDCPITKIFGTFQTSYPISVVLLFAKQEVVTRFKQYFYITVTEKDFNITTTLQAGTSDVYDFVLAPLNPCYLPAPSYTLDFECINGIWSTSGSITITSSILVNSVSPINHTGGIIVDGNFTVDNTLSIGDLTMTNGSIIRISNNITITSCAQINGGTLILNNSHTNNNNNSSDDSPVFLFKQGTNCDINKIKFDTIYVGDILFKCPIIFRGEDSTSLFIADRCAANPNYNNSIAVIVSVVVIVVLAGGFLIGVVIKRKWFKREWGSNALSSSTRSKSPGE